MFKKDQNSHYFRGLHKVHLDSILKYHYIYVSEFTDKNETQKYLDIVYIHGTNPTKTYTFDGMRINRIDTKIPLSGKIRWGSYMGSMHNGVYNK